MPGSIILYDNPLYENTNVRYNAGFFLWRVLLQDYGLPDPEATSLINLMCNSRLFTDGGALEEYGLIIHVRIGLKGELEKLLRKRFKKL